MPQFNTYPAMRARSFDLPAIMEQAQRLQGMRSQNRLRELQMQAAQGEQSRQAQLRGLMPGVGAEAGLGPKSQQALGLGADLGELMKITQAKRDRDREKVEQLSSLLAPYADPSIPELQKAQMWPQTLQQAQRLGLPTDNAPRTYDPQWIMGMRAQAGDYKNKLDEADKAFTLSPGQTRFGPGGEPIAALPDTTGGTTPAQRANNVEIDQARTTLDNKVLDKDEIYRRTQKAYDSGMNNPEYDASLARVVRMATQRKVGDDPDYRRYFGTYLGGVELSDPAGMRPLPPGVSAEQPGPLDRAYNYLFGGDETPAAGPGTATPRLSPGPGGRSQGPVASDDPPGGMPRARSAPSGPRGRRGGAGNTTATGKHLLNLIKKMSTSEITDLLTERGEDLTTKERNAIKARLIALGVPSATRY